VPAFVVIGQTALASGEYSLDDLPGSSGRIDVLLRCVRAALLVSHGLRKQVLVYLILRGGPLGPRAVRIDSENARFLRPDERSLAILLQKTLRASAEVSSTEFRELRPGLSVCAGDLDQVLADAGPRPGYVLDEQGDDLRTQPLAGDALFFIGDHLGFDEPTRARLLQLGYQRSSVGPVSLHSDDVVTLVTNELDRRLCSSVSGAEP
jgi:tRNA (pseudouridine54-N1)-methyltransferase